MMDSGARAIYGRLALSDARRVLPPHALADIFTAAFDTRKLILGVGPVIYPMAPDQAARALLPQARLRTQDDYIGCIIAGRKELFGDDEAALRAASSDTLQDLASRLLAEWPSGAAKVPRAGEAGSFFYVEMASCIPFDLQPETRVTLLGDAIHTMTPSLGRGANVALRDAGLLRNWIVKHHKGELSCDAALQAYEREMTTYGFEVVRRSADMGKAPWTGSPVAELKRRRQPTRPRTKVGRERVTIASGCADRRLSVWHGSRPETRLGMGFRRSVFGWPAMLESLDYIQ